LILVGILFYFSFPPKMDSLIVLKMSDQMKTTWITPGKSSSKCRIEFNKKESHESLIEQEEPTKKTRRGKKKKKKKKKKMKKREIGL
jgi:hypothetical protein